MFELTHSYVNLELFKNRKLTQEQETLLILGSIVPDISEFGLIPKGDTHHQGLKFLESLSKKYRYFGIGFILHGEKPRGLDYYAHYKYIPKKEKIIKKILRSYKKVFLKKTNLDLMAHIIIEFCFEHLTAEKNPELIKRVNKALGKKIVFNAFYNFANFFSISGRHTRIIVKIGQTDRLQNFFSNFRTLKGTTHNFQNFIFLKTVRDKTKKPNWLNRLTKSSYRFLKSRIKEKQFEQMFARCIEEIKKDHDSFLENSTKNLKRLIKEHNL